MNVGGVPLKRKAINHPAKVGRGPRERGRGDMLGLVLVKRSRAIYDELRYYSFASLLKQEI